MSCPREARPDVSTEIRSTLAACSRVWTAGESWSHRRTTSWGRRCATCLHSMGLPPCGVRSRSAASSQPERMRSSPPVSAPTPRTASSARCFPCAAAGFRADPVDARFLPGAPPRHGREEVRGEVRGCSRRLADRDAAADLADASFANGTRVAIESDSGGISTPISLDNQSNVGGFGAAGFISNFWTKSWAGRS